MIPGQYILQEADIICNAGRESKTINVVNTGDRPIQIGSHFHFYEVNEALKFARDEGYGMHLNIPAGAAVRFEPGDAKDVDLVPFTGERRVYGLNKKVDGALDRKVER